MLYRSDHLVGLTANDYRYLDQLGIRVVCDLRTPSERTKSPTRWQGTWPEIMSVSVLTDEELKAATTTPLSPEEFQKRLAAASAGVRPESSSYDRFVLKYADSYSRIFERLISGEVPALTHCSAGRDRTGVYSAMILTALGVPWSTVMDDYLLTNRYWLTDSMIRQRQRATQAQYGLATLPDAAAVRALYTLDGSMLERTFETIGREHGSFDAFRRTVLNVSDAELDTLRSRYLEP
jgi:protein-tyrosine phosphatase